MPRTTWIRRGAAVGALVVAGLVGGLASQAFAGGQSFVDVSPSNQFYADIEWMASSGIAGGYPDDTYRPGAPVTRQAMAAFIHRAQTQVYVQAQSSTLDAAIWAVTAQCPAGWIVSGGGASTSFANMFVTDSRPTGDREGWYVRVESDNDAVINDGVAYATAICVRADIGDAL